MKLCYMKPAQYASLLTGPFESISLTFLFSNSSQQLQVLSHSSGQSWAPPPQTPVIFLWEPGNTQKKKKTAGPWCQETVLAVN